MMGTSVAVVCGVCGGSCIGTEIGERSARILVNMHRGSVTNLQAQEAAIMGGCTGGAVGGSAAVCAGAVFANAVYPHFDKKK